MGTLTIRNVDDDVHARLRERAARHGRSVEAEVRGILSEAVQAPTRNFLLELHAQTADLTADLTEDLDLPPRDDDPREVHLP